MSLIYTLPRLEGAPAWKRALLGGWKYSDMTSVQSGASDRISMSVARSGLATLPDQIAPVAMPKTFNQWFSTASFVQPQPGFFGDANSATVLGPGLINFNMAVYKDFAIRERAKLQFRAELFNVFNHTNPNDPTTVLGNGNFGKITAAKDPRIGELTLKLSF
jgi:hypothetical protein